MRDWAGFNSLVRRQHGAVAVRQAPAFGISERSFRRITERQGWTRTYPGVVIQPATEPAYETWVSAAVLAVRGPVLASRLTAAYLLGMERDRPSDIELVIPHRRHVPGLAAASGPPLAIWRSRDLVRGDERPGRRLPSTTPARTFCDLAPVVMRERLRAMLIDARQRRIVEPHEVLARASSMRGGRRGLFQIKQLAYELDASRCDSVLAGWAARELERAGLVPFAHEHPVTTQRGVTVHFDIAFVPYRIAVEAEGMGAHSSRTQFEADLRRRNTLGTTDWQIIWLSWRYLERDRDGFIEEVRSALSGRGWPGPPR